MKNEKDMFKTGCISQNVYSNYIKRRHRRKQMLFILIKIQCEVQIDRRRYVEYVLSVFSIFRCHCHCFKALARSFWY